jgi:alpha-mannosidase
MVQLSAAPSGHVGHIVRIALIVSIAIIVAGPAAQVSAQQSRIYIANDEHTDYLWSADEAAYRAAWLGMLDYYLNQADQTDTAHSDFQGRFSVDGHYWLWTYEKNRSAAQFQRLIDRIRDGHITVPLHALVLVYGGMPAEAVIRSMYYAGRIERRFGLRFELASAMENQTMPFGLVSLWAGAGAKYSWQGVCGCGTKVEGLDNRGREIYRAVGPDGRSVLMKWHSFTNYYGSGGYAEANDPASAVSFATSNNTFLSRYPYDAVVGMFGFGGDNLDTKTTQFITTARNLSTPSRRVIVSNEVDFFRDFEQSAPAGSLPTFSGGFGNEWDLYPATMAEVTASVRRNVEALRSAEALATLVTRVDPGFMNTRVAAADSAFNAMGLYFEHDWTANGSASAGRPGFQRRLDAIINSYVSTLRRDASARLAEYVKSAAGRQRFYVFNPLGWTRTDVADLAVNPSGDFRVVDLTTGVEVRSQRVQTSTGTFIRILASSVPPVGYKVFEIQTGPSTFPDSAARVSNNNTTLENDKYRLTVNGRGALASVIDKRDGNRELVRSVGGLLMNDQGTGNGTPVAENVGPVSSTLLINAGGSPSHTVRVTLYHTVDRIDMDDEITSNFGNNVITYSFGFNLDGFTVRHEEVGGVATARLISQGGSYSDNAGRYDYLTMNHFVDITAGDRGVTLSNWDSPFFRLGSSSGASLDVSTPRVRALVGGRIDAGLGLANQNGDTYFRNRYALQRHGPYVQASAMRMAMEHQNPFVTSFLGSGSGPFPGTSYSLVSVSDSSVLLWGIKPAEESPGGDIILRLWNLDEAPRTATLTLGAGNLLSARRTTHIETDLDAVTTAGPAFTDLLPSQWLQTYRITADGTVSVPDPSSAENPQESFALLQNFPNPFNAQTRIAFSLPRTSTLTLTVSNLLGQEIRQLAAGLWQAGFHTVDFNASGLSSGVYFYRLITGEFRQGRSLVLIR